MRRPKCERPPPRDAVDGLGEVCSPAHFEPIVPQDPIELQARKLAARFGLTISTAGTVARLAFGDGAQTHEWVWPGYGGADGLIRLQQELRDITIKKGRLYERS
jgi:hypothetical protein